MNRLPLNVVQFAQGKTDVYEGVRDYFFHYMSEVAGKKLGAYDSTISLSEKDAKMNKALMSEVERVSGQVKPENMSAEQWATNPMIKWAIPAVASIMIDAVIPDTIIRSIGVYTDIKYVDYGEVAEFEVMPNSLMTTSQAGNAQRTTFKQKQFRTSKSLMAINHDVTVSVSLYKVLAGRESLAEFIRKAVLSIERDMTKDAYGALTTLVNAGTFPNQLVKTGVTTANVLNLCQVVTAYNMGNKATIVGTTAALANVLPDSAKGYRILTQSENMGIQLIKNFYDYDILELPQVATGVSYGLALDDTKVYIMSAGGTDKIVKGVVEGATLSNSNDYYDTANLSSNATFNKRWAFEAITNATMGVITVS
jgi:hypothetical protein